MLALEQDLKIAVTPVYGDLLPSAKRSAWGHLNERHRVPNRAGAHSEVDRQLGNLLIRKRYILFGVLGLQQGRLGDHLNRLAGSTHFQHDIDAGRDGQRYLDVGLTVFAETGMVGGERVRANRHFGHRVVAGSSGNRIEPGSRIRIGQGDLHARNQGARGIGNRSGDGAAGLGEDHRKGTQKNRQPE